MPDRHWLKTAQNNSAILPVYSCGTEDGHLS